ncbi:probable inactive serine/threonine-protein kinase fnkC [Olea europaea var. sylvestris]|uniref:probable inactive serine/threonine-protein kinase fnkC n=1 Tax=Olea europaea var. sylvestris TaxID=158386 RepID=UPI000C1CF6CB|nr:probable inactive serine/threonine-protein kinase fnkC [Olea europaea var. sylvestris]
MLFAVKTTDSRPMWPTLEVTTETRELSPAHFLVKIESFSLLSENGIDKYESSEFESGDYKWKLIIYPNGRNTDDGANHVSAYLVVADISSLPTGWEFNAFFGIFLFNHKLDNFMSMKGQRRFHRINPEWGFSNFIAWETLIDPTNGYIVDDKCLFGAEVFVIKITDSCKREFKLSKFSELKNEWYTEEFITGDHKWKLCVCPKGDGEQKGHCVSIFLCAVGIEKQSSYLKLNADFSICLKNQIGCAARKIHNNQWFSASDHWGWPRFIPMVDMNDPEKGFVVEDSCIIELQISIQAVVRSLT